MNFRERILARPAVYRTFKKIVLPNGVLESLVATDYQVDDGSAVLDLGCGFGDYAPLFAGRCSYLGIDHNEDYINTARDLNAGSEAEFLVADVTDPVVATRGPFDLIMLSGVLHHLDDATVEELGRSVAPLLKPGGRFVALEPVFDPDQGLTARLIIAADRGRFVRDAAGYRDRLNSSFDDVATRRVTGLLRIPYTHLVVTCTAA